MKTYSIAVLSDMHWGKAKNHDSFYKEMETSVIDVIKDYSVLDAIIITGDYWDRVLTMQHEAATLGILFMKKLFNICIDKGAKLRVVMGTKSHDNDMLQWFKILGMDYTKLDIDIIYTVKEEDLFEDLKILFIPEGYITSYDDYYSSFFVNDRYDMVFGHGLIDKASFVAAIQESEVTHPSAPVIKSDDLLRISKGPIFFGHIHTPMVIKKRIYYVGSTSRFAHGEEGDKGFYHLLYSPEDNSYKATFVVNKLAPKYITLTFSVNKSVSGDELLQDITKCIEEVKEFIQIRIRIIVEDGVELDKGLILTLQQRYSSRYFKLIIDNTNKIKQQMERDKAVKKILEEHDYLFDKNMDDCDRVSKYISKTKLKEIHPDRVRQILYEKYLT